MKPSPELHALLDQWGALDRQLAAMRHAPEAACEVLQARKDALGAVIAAFEAFERIRASECSTGCGRRSLRAIGVSSSPLCGACETARNSSRSE